MAAGGSDRQLSGDDLTVRRLKSGALPAAAASILNMLKRPRHSVGGALPPRGGDAAPMPGAPATASLASTTSAVRTSPPPGSQASWLAACPQAGGSSRSPPHTLTCVCPGPRAWEVKTRRQVTGQRPRPQHGRRSPTVCESATAGRPLSGSSAVGRTTTAWRLAGDVCAQAHAPHRRGKDSAVCHSPEHVTGYLRPSGGVRARAG